MAHAQNQSWRSGKTRKLYENQRRIQSHHPSSSMYELEQMTRTVQCLSCWKHLLEGLAFCSCGVCLRPDEATIRRIKVRFQALIVPCCRARTSRPGARSMAKLSGKPRSWESNECQKKSKETWQGHYHNLVATGEKYRNSQRADGWTEEYCRYLDYLTTIDISYTAPWHQKHRYESTNTLAGNVADRQAGPMKARRDFRPTTQILANLRQEQGGRQNSFIPKNESEAKTTRRRIASRIRTDMSTFSSFWSSPPNWRTYFSLAVWRNLLIFSSSWSSQNWWQHEHQDSQWREHQDTTMARSPISYMVISQIVSRSFAYRK